MTDDPWGELTARTYDTPGAGMFAPEVLGPTVERLAELADGGAALELAIGTGRVAVPLAGRGVPVELGVPELRLLPPGRDAVVHAGPLGYVGTATYDVLRQRLVSQHVWFSEDGGRGEARVLRTEHRYVWPAELDLMAELAGFVLESRHADWTGTPFTADSPSHVSVYRLPAGAGQATRTAIPG